MALRLGDTVPNFTQASTEGEINFTTGPETVVLLPPQDFTPVCTTELGEVARIKPEFDSNVKALALSVDDVNSHNGWAISKKQGVGLNYPILADPDKRFLTSTT